jgi:cleavage and polyadenylation specificity factor subunit 1
LTRNVQHIAGLNPRAFRFASRWSSVFVFVLTWLFVASSTVRNDTLSKPSAKGIVDGDLLNAFISLPMQKQLEVTRQIGTERKVVLKDLQKVREVW